MKVTSFYRLAKAGAVSTLLILSGCMEQSPTIVSFDVDLESTTFTNRLYTPVEIYRDGVVLDTLQSLSSRSYRLGRKGPVRHGWRIIAPLDAGGRKTGIEPSMNLGVQYDLNAAYTLDNELVDEGSGASRTIFTPLIANYSNWDLRLIVNYRTDDQVYTNYIIPRGVNIQLSHAPYFYWNAGSNVRLEASSSYYYYQFNQTDSIPGKKLELNHDAGYEGSGRTKTLIAE